MARPTEGYPEFALQDQTDPGSNGPNVTAPSIELRNSGWRYQQAAPSNIFNWLHRVVHKWIVHFDEWIQAANSSVISNSSGVTGTTVTNALNTLNVNIGNIIGSISNINTAISNLDSDDIDNASNIIPPVGQPNTVSTALNVLRSASDIIFDHVHDGGLDPESISKIDPIQHIEGVSAGDFPLSFTGFSSGEVTITVNYKVETLVFPGSTIQNVTLYFPEINAQAHGNLHPFLSTTGSAHNSIPEALRPKNTIYLPSQVLNAGETHPALLRIFSLNGNSFDGELDFFMYGNCASGPANLIADFATTGNKGFSAFTVSYPIFP
jgi:hypothetical protein